jgi:hypothetical protein
MLPTASFSPESSDHARLDPFAGPDHCLDALKKHIRKMKELEEDIEFADK